MEAVIIPTYKEKETIEKTITSVFSNLPSCLIMIVDDSPDDTADVVKKLQKKYKNLYLLKRNKKDGRGSAVMEGFSYALSKTKADTFLEMDADMSHDPVELPRLVEKSKSKTIVIGSRYIRGSKIVNWGILRRITSRASNIMVRNLLRMPISDNTNGYRCYTKDAVETLLAHKFKSKGYVVLSESAYVLFKKGFKFEEVPTIFVNRKEGKSKATLMEFINSFINVAKILNLKIEK